MRELFWLGDEAWTVIAPLLPTNQPGAHRVDDRRIISGIIHVLKSGCRWKDCPPEYGPTTTVYNRFNRWSRKDHWRRILAALAAGQWITAAVAMDGSYVKVHRCAQGGKGGPRLRRSASQGADRPRKSTRSAIRSADRSSSR